MNLLDVSFWFSLLVFIFACFFAFFIPGDVILGKFELSRLNRIVLAIIIGVSLWAWQGFIFGFAGIRWASYLYLICFAGIWLYGKNWKTLLPFGKISFKNNLLVYLIIFLGVIVQVSAVWFTGIYAHGGLYFCCGNVSDSLYHISLTDQIIQRFPPYEPGMNGVIVTNYHYLSNLVWGDLIRVFKLPLIATQFQFATVFISLLLGLSLVVVSNILKMKSSFTKWLLFFFYFGADFIYLLLFLLGKGASFRMGSLEDGAIFLVNPPRAMAIIVSIAVISLMLLWLKTKNFRLGIIMAILVGSLVGLKVYLGIFALTGLAGVSLYLLFKRDIKMLVPPILSVLLSAIIYFPVNSGAGGLYFTGFWTFENFIVQPILGLERMELARYIFLEHKNYLRIIQFELMYVGIYMFAIFGTKLLGLAQSKKSLSSFPLPLNIFLMLGIIVSAVLGFFFQQVSGGSNSFNFIVSIFIFSSFYAALACSYWLEKVYKPVAIVITILIITLTIPRIVYQFVDNIDHIISGKGFIINATELKALSALKEEDKRITLVDTGYADIETGTTYVGFMTGQPMFFSGKTILDSHNIPTANRYKISQDIVRGNNELLVGEKIYRNKIGYIMLPPEVNLAATTSSRFSNVILKNKRVKIVEIDSKKLKILLCETATIPESNCIE